jgi:hypothetical protein
MLSDSTRELLYAIGIILFFFIWVMVLPITFNKLCMDEITVSYDHKSFVKETTVYEHKETIGCKISLILYVIFTSLIIVFLFVVLAYFGGIS